MSAKRATKRWCAISARTMSRASGWVHPRARGAARGWASQPGAHLRRPSPYEPVQRLRARPRARRPRRVGPRECLRPCIVSMHGANPCPPLKESSRRALRECHYCTSCSRPSFARATGLPVQRLIAMGPPSHDAWAVACCASRSCSWSCSFCSQVPCSCSAERCSEGTSGPPSAVPANEVQGRDPFFAKVELHRHFSQ